VSDRINGRTSIGGRLGAALGSALLIALSGAFPLAVSADPASPLAVTKTANPSPVTSGGQLTYTISITNTGGAKVDSVVMTDQVNGVGTVQNPPGLPQLTITSTQGPCNQGGANGNVVTCQIGTLPGGGTVTITIRGQVTASSNTVLNNTASVTGTKSAQNFTTNASVSVLVQSSSGGGQTPDLTLNKTGPTSVATGGYMTYTLTVNNLGDANTANVKVVDTLPAGVTLQAGLPTDPSPPFETTSLFSCSATGTNPITVTCTGGAVNAGQNATIKINAIAPATAGQITNTATVDPDNAITESNELNNSAAVSTNVTTAPPTPLLTIFKTDNNPTVYPWSAGAGPDPVNPGQLLTYKIQVKNNATTRADDVTITDGTQGLEASSITVSQVVVNGTVGNSGGCTVSAPQVRCTDRTLNPGGTITITITGIVVQSAGGTIFNTATVTGNIKNQGVSATDSESTTIRPPVDFTITKSDSPDPVCARSWPRDTPPAGETGHLAYPPNGLSAASGDVEPPDLLAPAVCLGGLTYDFVIGNSGNGDAINSVTVRDPLPAGLIFDSYDSHDDGDGFVCSLQAGNVVLCTGGTIFKASTATISLRLVAPATVGSITNKVTVDPNNAIFEPDETNNDATATTTVSTGVDLVIWKGDDHTPGDAPGPADPTDNDPPGAAPPLTEGFDPIATNGTQTYTIIVDDVGPQNVTGIKVRDVLPAGTKFLSFSATNGFTCSHDGSALGGVVTCIGGHLLGTEAEFYNPPGAPGTAAGNEWATIKIKVSATSFVQPAMHNEVRVDPDNEIAEINELNNYAEQNTFVTTGNAGMSAFNQLTIDKTQVKPLANGPVATNGTIIYNLHVENLGTDPVSNVVVQDYLPAGSRFISATDITVAGPASAKFFCSHDGSATGGTVTCTGGDFSGSINVIPGPPVVPTARDIEIRIFAPGTPRIASNLATVDPFNVVNEGNEFDNDDQVDTTVRPCTSQVDCDTDHTNAFYELTIDKTQTVRTGQKELNVEPDQLVQVRPGDLLEYKLHVTNIGEGDAFNVTVRDIIPSFTTFSQAFDTAPTTAGAFSCSYAAPNVDCTGGAIPGGGSRDIIVRVYAPTQLEDIVGISDNVVLNIINRAFIDPNNDIPEGNETNNSDRVNTRVLPKIDLTLTKEGPTQATQNQTTNYTVKIKNNIPADWSGDAGQTAFHVTVVDNLPIGLIPIGSATAEPGNFSCQTQENPVNRVTCVGDLAPGDSNEVTITVPVFITADGGTLDNEACIDTERIIDETDETNNCFHTSTSVSPAVPNISINKTADKGTVTAGDTLTYTISVSNQGAGNETGQVRIEDTLPTQVTKTNINADAGWDCTASTATKVDCKRTGLNAGDTSNVKVETTVNSGVTADFTNTATVHWSGTDKTASVTTNAGGAAIDLILSGLSDSPDPANVGQNITYTFAVSNGGSSPSGSFDITAKMDSGALNGLKFVGAAASQGFICGTIATDTVTCTGTLLAGQSTNVTVEFQVLASSPTSHTLAVKVDPTNAIPESSNANNDGSETTTVTASLCTSCIDLVAGGVLDTPDPVAPGGSMTYIATMSNAGDISTAAVSAGAAHILIALDPAMSLGTYSATAGFTCFDYVASFGLPWVECYGDLGAGEGVAVTINATASGAADGDVLSTFLYADPWDALPQGTGFGDEFSNDNNSVIESTDVAS
jgi:uncharacterized repeat protein (TIGR01451 family)/fimbrial isopeptide formation D2 family protein